MPSLSFATLVAQVFARTIKWNNPIDSKIECDLIASGEFCLAGEPHSHRLAVDQMPVENSLIAELLDNVDSKLHSPAGRKRNILGTDANFDDICVPGRVPVERNLDFDIAGQSDRHGRAIRLRSL